MVASLLAATPAFGQALPTREQVEQQPPEATAPPSPRVDIVGRPPQASPCALARPEYQSIRFTPSEVVFEGLKAVSPDILRSAYADYVGREQPVSVVCEIRDRAAAILNDAGYIASVEVPEQRIAEGRVMFRVLMAKMVAVRVRGDAGAGEEKIASYLRRLTEEEVFNRHKAERTLLLAGDLPGYSVRLALRPAGGAPGEVIGEVTVRRTPVMIDANIQNYGSHALGRWGALVRGQIYGLTGLGDRTTLSAFSTLDFEEQQTLQIGHDFRPGSSGLAIGGQFTYSWTHPNVGDPDISIKGRTLFATLTADYPLIRSQSFNLIGGVGLDIVNQDVTFNGLDLSRDRLRVAFARLAFDARDMDFGRRGYSMAQPRWRLGGNIEVRRGLDFLGATDRCIDDLPACLGGGNVPPSSLEADPTATVLRGEAFGELRPFPRFTLAAAARAQHSKAALFSFESFSAGNYTIGRGYDPGALLGDSGIGLQGEVRFGSPYPTKADGISFEPFAFVDQAWAWNEDRIGGPFPREELTSVGGGVRAGIGDQFRIEAMVAAPLDRIRGESKRRDPRFLLSLTTRLVPWSFR